MLFKIPIKFVNLFHAFVLGVILTIIGILKDKTPSMLYYLLALIALLIPIFQHFPRFTFKSIYWELISILHYFVFLPGLLYLSYLGIYNSSVLNPYFTTISASGVSISTYHIYKFITRII
tara:strand:- start:14649 stop:15008 length:360 start_codon:yes stop_codon:yes gene_type:complete